jgi:hypothetical protein
MNLWISFGKAVGISADGTDRIFRILAVTTGYCLYFCVETLTSSLTEAVT